MTPPLDLAQIRFNNANVLFDEFVQNTVKRPDAATLRGLERRFAERLQVQPSYWSQIKGRSRQIGERLARQFELLCHKPNGWMDHDHTAPQPVASVGTVGAPPAGYQTTANDTSTPADDDERFIIGLVLTYYRRHPQKARTRLLDLLGEVLTPPGHASEAAKPPSGPKTTGRIDLKLPSTSVTAVKNEDDVHALWLRSQSGVAPLRQKK